MEQLEQKLGYEFRDRRLLEQALNHSSYANEHRSQGIESNERLEFLGDSVLGFVSADHLYKTFAGLPEGDLTRMRAALVCEQSLYEVACQWEIGQYLKLGKGEEAGGGRQRQSILADGVEAILAAVYLDGGMEAAARIIHRFILEGAAQRRVEERKDYKTALQELVQREEGRVLTYRQIGESGPDHNKTFSFEVLINDCRAGCGSGHSKKEAEQAAARSALEAMGEA